MTTIPFAFDALAASKARRSRRPFPGWAAWLVGLGSAVALSACIAPDDEFDDAIEDPEVASAEQDLRGGIEATATSHRREVGRWGGCTATAIAPQWVITAASCWDFLDTIDTSLTRHIRFETSDDGRRWGEGACTGCQSIETDRTIMLSSETSLGRNDIALVRLSSPLHSWFLTPATIATAAPRSDDVVTTWGLGCTRLGGGTDDTMRFRFSRAGSVIHTACPGDGGGPRFIGTGRLGQLFATTSFFSPDGDGFADVSGHRTEILNIIRAWTVEPLRPDVGRGPFCISRTQQTHWGDVNGDGQPDAICHEPSTGRIDIAENRLRHISFVGGATAGEFCFGGDAKLYTGDFNGDGRTDFLCRESFGTRLRLHVAQPTSAPRYRLSGTPHQSITTGWCTRSTEKFLVGDFNGDRRTDLLCHDNVEGTMSILYTDAAGRISTSSDGDFVTNTRWCSHAGTEVFTGEFNRDGRTDLLCFTRPTGFLHVQLSRGGARPFDGIDNASLSATRTTSQTCSVDSNCADGQLCESGRCRERLCTRSGTLLVGDYSGDGISDVVCEYPTGRTFGVRPFAGRPSTRDGLLQNAEDYFIGWGGKLRLRSLQASSQPWNWQPPRAGLLSTPLVFDAGISLCVLLGTCSR